MILLLYKVYIILKSFYLGCRASDKVPEPVPEEDPISYRTIARYAARKLSDVTR